LLKNDLYTVNSITESPSALLVSVELNGAHPLFKGHFPGQPVLPGVCMLEMIQEMMAEQQGQKLRISKGPLIKFLAMIVPERNPSLLIELNYEPEPGGISVRGRIYYETTVFMKYHLVLVPEPD
jgi:3-hydroxyacyl-[acyl-carrier-protein] dehydratase